MAGEVNVVVVVVAVVTIISTNETRILLVVDIGTHYQYVFASSVLLLVVPTINGYLPDRYVSLSF